MAAVALARTPTACSWLNTVIKRYIAEHNGEPKPFVWTADPERVLAAIRRGKQAQP